MGAAAGNSAFHMVEQALAEMDADVSTRGSSKRAGREIADVEKASGPPARRWRTGAPSFGFAQDK
jgi:hypothetical protein